jgi:hypothetical protein
MANELVARNGLRVSGSTFLGNVTTDQTLLSVLAIDSSNEVKDLSLATFAGDFVTGATLSGTGDKDLVLTQYDGSTITLTDINLHVDSASFDLASGDATLTQNDGNTVTLSLGTDFVTGVTEANNTISVTKNGGATVDYDITALTGLTYAGGQSGSWSLDYEGSDITAGSVELPFITGATLDLTTGTLELEVNNGLENNFSITGFSTTNSDTFVTGGTIVGDTLTLGRNDGNDVVVAGFSFDIDGDNSGGGSIEMGDTLSFVGGTGMTVNTDGATPGSVTVILDNTAVSTGSYGAADTVATFTVDQQGRLTAASDVTIDITASQVSDFALSAETAIFQSGNFTNTTGASGIDFTVVAGDSVSATLVNSSTTFAGTTGTSPEVDLGGTLSFISSDGSVVVSGDSGTDTFDITVSAGVDTFITGGTYTDNTGVLTLTDNDGTVITVDGEWNHLESASIANNVITFTSNTGQTSTVTVDAVTGLSISSNVISVSGSGSLGNDITVDAVTGVTYGSWDVSFDGSGTLGTTPVELPFITGGTYNAGTVTLGINGGVESDIVITGLTTNDTYVTGATVDFQEVTLELNQSAPDVVIDSEQTIRYERVGPGTLVNIPVGTYGAAHVEYTIIEGAGARSGFFTAVFNAGSVEYADWSTMDIGSLTGELSANAGGDIIFTGAGRLIANVRAVAL